MFDFFRMVKYEVKEFRSGVRTSIREFFCNHRYIAKLKNMGAVYECDKCGRTIYHAEPWHDIKYK